MRFVAILLPLLVGCEPAHGPPLASECRWDDNYTVGFAVYTSESDLRSAYEFLSKARLLETSYVKGFATMNTRTGKHTLHFQEPRGQNDHDRIETIGHELMHPVCGPWHP